MVNNCLFLDNVALTTNAGLGAFGGAIATNGKLTVVDSIFKKNKALSDSNVGGGGAFFVNEADALVLSSVFELNEASGIGGAAQFVSTSSVAWYSNKELLFGNDAGIDCDGGAVGFNPPACFNVTDSFSL